ncbi:MAG TPA: 4Fe-4S dicluster domain-containing protein, partial [Candidatus Altiarchaeales archaeon]|nr:4Fe-4S dicluster domain-containing protein [Candidatus Altiarchaeales archaeon]
LGVSCEATAGMIARVACNGGANCKDKFEYTGIKECSAAIVLLGGQKMCDKACLGFGDCAKACPFGAIKMVDGLPQIDWKKCTGCGVCVDACPKGVIHLAPAGKLVHVMCRNTQAGVEVGKVCSVGCIACRICEKNCPKDAIHVINNCAIVDYETCINCGICVQKCPKKIIVKKEK